MSAKYCDKVEITNLPLGLVEFLKDLLSIRYFVETGTGLGRTTRVASRLFERVWTIEAHEGRWREAARVLSDCRNVTCLWGDSTEDLSAVLARTGGSAVVFLDAHCVYRVRSEKTSCPLLSELKVVRKDDVVLIDDVKYFMAPPPSGVVRDEWPELVEIMDALRAKTPEPYIFIYGNCLVTVPRCAKRPVDEYVRERIDYSPFKVFKRLS